MLAARPGTAYVSPRRAAVPVQPACMTAPLDRLEGRSSRILREAPETPDPVVPAAGAPAGTRVGAVWRHVGRGRGKAAP